MVHGAKALAAQRAFGVALGHEDVNDRDELRFDPVAGSICEVAPHLGPVFVDTNVILQSRRAGP